MTSFSEKVYNVVKCIPRGRVLTYGVVAEYVGKSHAARAVGNALNRNRSRAIPCHRVIRSDGSTGGYARGMQKKIDMLKKEGVPFIGSKVDPCSIVKLNNP